MDSKLDTTRVNDKIASTIDQLGKLGEGVTDKLIKTGNNFFKLCENLAKDKKHGALMATLWPTIITMLSYLSGDEKKLEGQPAQRKQDTPSYIADRGNLISEVNACRYGSGDYLSTPESSGMIMPEPITPRSTPSSKPHQRIKPKSHTKQRSKIETQNVRESKFTKEQWAIAYPDGFQYQGFDKESELRALARNIELPKSLKKEDILQRPRIKVGNCQDIKKAVPADVYWRIKKHPLLQKYKGTQAGVAVAAVLCRNEHITAAYCGEFGRICQDFAEVNRHWRHRTKDFEGMKYYTDYHYHEVPWGKGKYIKIGENKYEKAKDGRGNYKRGAIKRNPFCGEHHLVLQLTKQYIKQGLSPAEAKKKATNNIPQMARIGSSVVINNGSHDNWGSHFEIPIKYHGGNKYTVISYPGKGKPANVYYKYYGPNKDNREPGLIVRLYNQKEPKKQGFSNT